MIIIGVSIIRPMYYEFPESEEAYTYQTQVCIACYMHVLISHVQVESHAQLLRFAVVVFLW